MIRCLVFALPLPLCGQIKVLTYRYDNSRAGANRSVVSGKVCAGTQTALAVCGLLSGSTAVEVSNAAGGHAPAVAPGSIVAIYGSVLATSTATATSYPIPTALGGAGVTVGGIGVPILDASHTQLNVQISFEVSPGTAQMDVTVNGPVAGAAPVVVAGSISFEAARSDDVDRESPRLTRPGSSSPSPSCKHVRRFCSRSQAF